jgi:hypothetical protein
LIAGMFKLSGNSANKHTQQQQLVKFFYVSKKTIYSE